MAGTEIPDVIKKDAHGQSRLSVRQVVESSSTPTAGIEPASPEGPGLAIRCNTIMRRGLVFATSICRASHNCEAYATWACLKSNLAKFYI